MIAVNDLLDQIDELENPDRVNVVIEIVHSGVRSLKPCRSVSIRAGDGGTTVVLHSDPPPFVLLSSEKGDEP